jgi:probable F420-dependent oxidoreductase
MKVDALVHGELAAAAESARLAEGLGFDGVICSEVAHDPFLPLALAAPVTSRVELATGIAVAFARSPMTVAVTAMDLHRLSGGRFILGLGSQIRPHIVRRYSMPWSPPASRMREFVAALRAIWASWENGTPLRFTGEHYQHTLMTPMFTHGPSEFGQPKVFLAGVGPAMTRLAGEVADGFFAHAFTTADYLRDVTLPQLGRGLADAGRARDELEVAVPVFTLIGRGEEEIAARLPALRAQIAFYGSTPAYRGVLEHHGWGDLGDELHRLSVAGEWKAMGEAIPDEVLHTFAVIGDPATAAVEFRSRFTGLLDRIQIGLDPSDPVRAAEYVGALRAQSVPGASAVDIH